MVCFTYMRKLTISVSDEVYAGLRSTIAPRKISRFLDSLARPHVVCTDLDAAYQAMAEDQHRESEASLWSEGLISDTCDEARCSLVGEFRSGGRR